MHNFEKLIFWQKSIDLAKQIYLICKEISNEEKFGLIAQMKKCSVSIPSNIAEGAGRNTPKEFSHFLSITLGSAFELQTQLILTKELELLPIGKVDEILYNLIEIQKMIYTFKNKIYGT